MSFESCINDAVQRKEIDQDEGDEILAQFREYVDEYGMARPAARARIAKEREIMAATKRRQKMLATQAKDNIDQHLLSHKDYKGRHDAIGAAYGLYEDFGYAGVPNARFYARSVEARAYSKIADALQRYQRRAFSGGRKNFKEMGALQRAMFGETAAPEIQALAKELLDACDWLRRLFNDHAGNTIPKLENWGGPQALDAFAVQNAGGQANFGRQIGYRLGVNDGYSPAQAKAAFADDMREELDWTKMRNPWTGELFGQEVPSLKEKNRILKAVWNDIVTGHDFEPAQRMRGRNAVANSRSDHRFLVYKSSEAKQRVMEKYGAGSGDVVGSIIHYIQSMSRDIGLMKIFGPNPAAMNQYLQQFVEREARAAAAGDPNLVQKFVGMTPSSIRNEGEKAKKVLEGYYRQFRGEDQSIGNIGLMGTVLRNWDMSSLIGSAVIPHVVINPIIQASARYMAGVPIAQMIPHIIRSMAGATQGELLRAGLDFSQGAFDIGQGARQLDGLRRIARFSRHLPDKATHLSGLNVFIKANKLAMARDMSALMGTLQSTPWDGLPEYVRTKMQGYGMDERDWSLIQHAPPYMPAVDSAPWVTPREVAKVGELDPRWVLDQYGHEDMLGENDENLPVPYAESLDGKRKAYDIAEDVALKLGMYFAGENEAAVPQSSMRVRHAFVGETNPGSFWGFVRRGTYMFHSFQGSMWHSQLTGWAHRAFGRNGRGASKAAFGVFAIAMIMGGVISLILKNWRSTKTTPSLTDPRTWAMGAATSLAIPMIDEAVQSDLYGYGMRLPGTGLADTIIGGIGGPPVRTLKGALDELGIISNYARARRGRHKRDLLQQIETDAINTARNHTAILSHLWYAQAPYNRMVLDQLQHSVDPYALNDGRMREKRLNQETGQKFYWPPFDRLPLFAPWNVPTH